MTDQVTFDHHARLQALRAEMARQGLDGFVVPLTDEHMSEYVGDYAKRLEWLTGFRGSAGSAIVLADRAAIFTDGRYMLQVRQQVDAADWAYVDVPQTRPAAWLRDNAGRGARIGYDAWLHARGWVAEVTAALGERGGALVAVAQNPLDAVWPDRPPMSSAALSVHDERFAGQSAAHKRAEIADVLVANALDATVMTALDSVAWTFNLRGRDVAHTPVGIAYALLHADATADLFVDSTKVDDAVRAHLGNGVRLHEYSAFPAMLTTMADKRVAVDPERAVGAIFDALTAGGAHIVPLRDPAVLAKAVKNEVEQAGTRVAHARDGVALTRFLHWLSEAEDGTLSEIGASDRLHAFRQETGALVDLSFDTISGAGPNGAIVHYKAAPETDRMIERASVYLIDSGGQYVDGTTDVTRTVWIGPDQPPADIRDRFTRVLKGHIAIATAVFPAGTSGGQLDTLARQHLWAAGVDYAHGTGHGVGSFLAVHEGPQRIAKPSGGQSGADEPLRAGMLLSNEPGYYKAGAYGIRIENLILVEDRVVVGGEHRMLGFETLTFAPIDRALVDPALLTDAERDWLDSYHARVMTVVGASLDDTRDVAVKRWLEQACAPIRA